jgi:hypothetical protein
LLQHLVFLREKNKILFDDKMKKSILLFLLIFVLLFLPSIVFATNFIAEISPKVINSSIETQMNLNITNLNTTYNIIQINLILPQNFAYQIGTCQPSENCSYSQNPLTWNYVIQNGSSFVFNFSVIANVNGTYYYNVSTLDSSGANVSNITNTFDVNDTKPPTWSFLNAPPTLTPYATGKIYYFNITWDDNINISKVIFNWNGIVNYTYPDVKNVSKVYSINLTDLSAGNYTYYWFANDTNGNSNQTSIQVLNITKADNPIDVYFNLSKNQNATVVNGSTLTINATGQGELNLSSVKAQLENIKISYPYTFTSLGMYDFTISATGNQNYTSNSSTFFVMVVPNYTISYSVPTSYSSTSSSFSINFSSPPGIDNLFLELNGVRYVMTNSSLTTYSYSSTLPADSYSWQILGNYSNHIFNLTALNSFTIQKASPSVSLTAYPGWIVYEGNQTRVSCSSPYVSVSLYRNNTAVQNPDSQTLPVGDYLYICNSTEKQNYSAQSVSNILSVIEIPTYVVDLAFTQVENLIFITQNSSNLTIIKVKNTGNLTQTVYFWIENINSSWYSINSTNASLTTDKEVAFLINFSIGEVELKDYTGNFKANSTQKSINSSFVLKVLPSKSFQEKIVKYLADYEKNYTALAGEINRTKKEGYNTSLAEQKINQLKALLDQAKKYVDENDYSSAYSLFDNIRTLIGETKIEIDAAIQRGKIKYPLPNWIIYSIIAAVVTGISLFLAYLFWPTKEVIVPKMPVSEKKESFLEKIKKFLKIKRSYHYGME